MQCMLVLHEVTPKHSHTLHPVSLADDSIRRAEKYLQLDSVPGVDM